MSQQPAAPLPPSVPEHSLAALISRGAMLKAQMNLAQEELGKINQQIADQTRFLEGKNTGHVFGGGYDVTVQKRTNVKWDQGKLRAAREALGDDDFFKVFTWEFKPSGANDLKAFLQFGGDKAKRVLEAMTVTVGAPQVTYTRIRQEGEN